MVAPRTPRRTPQRSNQFLRAALRGAAAGMSHAATTSSRSTSGGVATTSEKETRVLYKRKRLTGKGKRRLKSSKRFARRVQGVIRKELGSQVMQFNNRSQIAVNTGALQYQGLASVSLVGYSGEAAKSDDMAKIFTNYFTSPADTNKVLLNSVNMNLTLQCPNTTETMVCDVYTCFLKKQSPTSYGDDFVTMITALEAQDSTMNSGTDGSVHSIGWTPFMSPSVCRAITITQKRRIILNGGKLMTLSLGGKMHQRVSYQDVLNFDFKRRMSKFLLFIFSGRNAAPSGTTQALWYPSVALNLDWTRSYNFDVLKEDASTTSVALQA